MVVPSELLRGQVLMRRVISTHRLSVRSTAAAPRPPNASIVATGGPRGRALAETSSKPRFPSAITRERDADCVLNGYMSPAVASL